MTREIRGGAGALETAAILAAIARYDQEVAAAGAMRHRPTARPAWVAADEVWAYVPEKGMWQPVTPAGSQTTD